MTEILRSEKEWIKKADSYYSKEKYPEAIRCYEEAIKLNSELKEIWYKCGLSYKMQKEYAKSIACFERAIEINETYEHPWNSLGNVFRLLRDDAKALECYKKAIEVNANNKYPWNGIGNVYFEQDNYDRAMECYKKSIEIDDNYKMPWNGLGNVYREHKAYSKAIECYNRSIEIDGSYEYPWNGLGNVHKDEKNYDLAVECYEKSITLNENFEYPWNGLGVIYKEKKDYDKAIYYYKKSLSINPRYKTPYNNLGNLCFELYKEQLLAEYAEQLLEYDVSDPEANRVYGNFLMELKYFNESTEYLKCIKNLFNKASDLYESEKNNSGLSLVKISLEKLETLLNELETSENTPTIELNSPMHRVMSAIKENKIRDRSNITKRSFLPFINETPEYKANMTTADSEPDIYFEVLRRWNSYTPIIAENYEISKGGGYFIKNRDKGIVIDPGFNFIDNFKNAGHFFKDIDAIFISHAHNDHMADLESILTLLHKYNDEIKESDDITKEDTIKKELSERHNLDYNKVSTEDIEKEFLDSHRRKIIEFYMPLSVFKFYSGLFELTYKTNYRIHIIEDGTISRLTDSVNADPNDAFVIRTIKAKHRDMISDICAVGLAIEFRDVVILYTGDTGWNEEIEKQYLELKALYEDKYVVLLAHIGGFKDCEDNYITDNKDSELFYKNHLGRLGLVRLNENLNPDICLISEFGEEFKGSRTELADIFGRAFDENILFFPVDIGFRLDLTEKKIKCIYDAEDNPYELKYSYREPSEIKAYEHKKNYSLHYYDRKLVLGELTAVVSELVSKNAL